MILQGTVVVPEIPTPPPWVMMDPPAMVLMALGFFAAVALITWPLVRALARRIEGKGGRPDPAMVAEVDELRVRVAELEQQQLRFHEIEERLDFTERLLAQQREQPRLHP
ncbi:MAG TPA: hypothetical protein VFO06_09185 [Gemmatimonadales bacterium]|nr:hypothetical protein [Gemmatimonadales bacterium]